MHAHRSDYIMWIYSHSAALIVTVGIHKIKAYVRRSNNTVAYWVYTIPMLKLFQRTVYIIRGGCPRSRLCDQVVSL